MCNTKHLTNAFFESCGHGARLGSNLFKRREQWRETVLRTVLFFLVPNALDSGIKSALCGMSMFTTNKRLICPGKGSQTQMNVMNYGSSKKKKKKDTPHDG